MAKQNKCAAKALRIENRHVKLQLCAANSSADVSQFKNCCGAGRDHLITRKELEKEYRRNTSPTALSERAAREVLFC